MPDNHRVYHVKVVTVVITVTTFLLLYSVLCRVTSKSYDHAGHYSNIRNPTRIITNH